MSSNSPTSRPHAFPRTVVVAKETSDYRIVTEAGHNWYIVANRPIARGELVAPPGPAYTIDVRGEECMELILEPTGERRRVYTASHGVPSDASCVQSLMEIPWCLVNHSCEPSTCCGPPRNLLEAARDIAKGEELTFDYALEQYDYALHRFECQCGAKTCRGMVGGFNDLNPDERERLLPHASTFVQERHRSESNRNVKSPRGRHMVVDYWECDADLLNDEVALRALINEAAHAAGASVLSTHSRRFNPLGLTAVAVLAESHISIHTWPEARYAGVDVYTCGTCDPRLAHESLAAALSAGRSEVVELQRGRAGSRSIATVRGASPPREGLQQDGEWFLEGAVPGCRYGEVSHGFHITDVVHRERTRFQDCLVFDSPVYGRVLVLDGIVQLSTLDEHIYHEMIVHPPMFTHPEPKRVVIVGGGDGGTLREVLRHDPEEVVMIDIDERFVRIAAEKLPSLSAGAFEDPRVTLLFEDASEALRRYDSEFDVAIIDCNGAVGPSLVLFEDEFYATVARSLTDGGVCSAQAGSMLDVESLQQMRRRMARHLGSTTGFRLTMPSYHSGEYVFLLASQSYDPSGPDATNLAELQAQRGTATRFWSPAMHHASQVLPPQVGLWGT